MRIVIFLFIYLLTLAPIYSKSLKTITYPFTAKELIFECKAWIPGETAVQQKAKKEVSRNKTENKKVLLSPHAATFTKECTSDMAIQTAQNIIDFFDKKLNESVIVKL